MKGKCPRLTFLLALMLMAAVCLSCATASASAPGNGNAFVPNTNYTPTNNSTTNNSTTSGTRSGDFKTPEEIAALTGGTGTTTPTTNTPVNNSTGSGSRNSSFLTAAEIAAMQNGGKGTTTGTGIGTTSGTRDSRFLTSEEANNKANIPSSQGNRSKNYLVPGEVPRDINGNPLVSAAGGVTTTTTGTRIGNCREFVNVRASDSTKGEIVGKAYLNESISIVRWNSDGSWAYVSYNGGNGWVKGTFIKK